MKYIVFVALIALTIAEDYQSYPHIGHPDLIEKVNSGDHGWVAGENEFTGMSFEDFKNQKLGLL